MRKANINWYKRLLSNRDNDETESETFERLYRDWGREAICLEYNISKSCFHKKRRQLGVPLIPNGAVQRKQFDYWWQLRVDLKRYGLQQLIEMNKRKHMADRRNNAEDQDPWELET